MLFRSRPEYGGALSRTAGAQTISLAPLNSAQTAALTTELLGPDPSVTGLAARIAHRVILSLKRLGAGHSSGWFSSVEPLSLRG